ncbi:MAG TPA: heavy metal translocating P-type ATPase [Gammaproteobacteria bacterium]|nr:heavy metal translocating P-type ATPase [Gammaproteobacteria bacterium]
MNNSQDPVSCFHCGLPVPPELDISVNYHGEKKPMCCYGCQAVSQAIIDSGMDDFYRYRTSTPEKPGELVPEFLQQLKAYDSPDVQKKFVAATDSENIYEVSLILEGITCAACVWLNEKHLNALDGIIDASINYSTHRARVRWDNSKIRLSDILESVSRIGYLAHPYDPEQHQLILEKERKAQIRRIGLSGLLGMQLMIFAVAMYTGDWWGMEEGFRQAFRWISLAITIPILLFASSVFFKSAWRDISNRRVGMDVPVSLGIGIAFVASVMHTIKGSGEVYYDSVAMFTFFLLSARYFEITTRKQTSEATEALLNLTPAVATRLIDYENRRSSTVEDQENISVSELSVGDYLLVRPGEVIPADGVIVSGSSGINESLITGESLPVTRSVDDAVIGGSTNTENPLIIRVTKLGEDSVLSSIQRLIDEAQHTKPAITRLADRIAGWFVSILLSIAAVVAWYWYSPDSDLWLEITIATLVVSCPCALSLATPTAITAASGQLAKIGLLPKSPHALETLAHATDFVFDKTGTLTEGRIELQGIHLNPAVQKTLDDRQALLIAASLEASSEHPIARALLESCRQPLLKVEGLAHITGRGISGRIEGETWFIGNRAFIEENCRQPLFDARFDSSEGDDSNGKIYLASSEQCIAVFLLSDHVREEAPRLISELKHLHKTCHLMTGDREENARQISRQLGIDHTLADLHPEDKLKAVKALQNAGAIVVMTGDGVNDAPVLAGADLSIAMGKGTQLAAAAADMILISNNIEHIYHGLKIASKTLGIIRQNLSWALLYNITAIPAAAAGYVEPWMAALGMSASSLVVVINAMRLNRIRY